MFYKLPYSHICICLEKKRDPMSLYMCEHYIGFSIKQNIERKKKHRKTFQISLIHKPIKWLNFKQIWFRDPMSHAVKEKKKTEKKIKQKLISKTKYTFSLITDIYYNLFVCCILYRSICSHIPIPIYCLHNKMLNHFNATRCSFLYS